MGMSFFALPSQQGPVQGRFKPTHLPISLSAKVAACVRRFETPTALDYGRTESKKDIPMLGSLGSVTNSRSASVNGQERYLFKDLNCYKAFNIA
jgi:hypothetical protein